MDILIYDLWKANIYIFSDNEDDDVDVDAFAKNLLFKTGSREHYDKSKL